LTHDAHDGVSDNSVTDRVAEKLLENFAGKKSGIFARIRMGAAVQLRTVIEGAPPHPRRTSFAPICAHQEALEIPFGKGTMSQRQNPLSMSHSAEK
jgi:hypothetical protein